VAVVAEARAVTCPACGSTNVAGIPLSLIQARYFKCGDCVVTFREITDDDAPDIERFNTGFLPPEGSEA
jgi:transposase-like protein